MTHDVGYGSVSVNDASISEIPAASFAPSERLRGPPLSRSCATPARRPNAKSRFGWTGSIRARMPASWWRRKSAFTEQAGLDVEVGPGKGSGNTAQAVAEQCREFRFADGDRRQMALQRGMDIGVDAVLHRRTESAVIVLASSDIKTPKDLEGKTIAIAAGSTQFQQWPAFGERLRPRCEQDFGSRTSILPAVRRP